MRKKLDGGARILLTRLQARGYGAYIVGGAVRDMLRGATPHDYDIATSAVPAQTRAVFTDLRTYDTGAAHGTVGVIYDGKTYEITTFRRDGAYSDGRRPATFKTMAARIATVTGVNAALRRKPFFPGSAL